MKDFIFLLLKLCTLKIYKKLDKQKKRCIHITILNALIIIPLWFSTETPFSNLSEQLQIFIIFIFSGMITPLWWYPLSHLSFNDSKLNLYFFPLAMCVISYTTFFFIYLCPTIPDCPLKAFTILASYVFLFELPFISFCFYIKKHIVKLFCRHN